MDKKDVKRLEFIGGSFATLAMFVTTLMKDKVLIAVSIGLGILIFWKRVKNWLRIIFDKSFSFLKSALLKILVLLKNPWFCVYLIAIVAIVLSLICILKTAALEKEVSRLTEEIEKRQSWDVAGAGSRRVLEINGVKFAFRFCPSGKFMMGSEDENETSGNETFCEKFWICETETTQEQWDAVGIKRSEKINRNEEYEDEFKGTKLPVVDVSYSECDAFVQKLNDDNKAPFGWRFTLPTEVQWEYACRAGTTGSTYGVPLDEAAWYSNVSRNKIHKVGTKTPNEWGIFDMLGNVMEWTNPKDKNKSPYVNRGGSCFTCAQNCRPAFRYYFDPANRNNDLGFRCVLIPSQSK